MGAIDADAHVIETVQTWSYLEGDERRFMPQLMTQSFGAELLSNEGSAVPARAGLRKRRVPFAPTKTLGRRAMFIVRERQ